MLMPKPCECRIVLLICTCAYALRGAGVQERSNYITRDFASSHFIFHCDFSLSCDYDIRLMSLPRVAFNYGVTVIYFGHAGIVYIGGALGAKLVVKSNLICIIDCDYLLEF